MLLIVRDFALVVVFGLLLVNTAFIVVLYRVVSINVTTHGACAVLAGGSEVGETVLPVLDYEFDGVEACNARYAGLRPPFEQTFGNAVALSKKDGATIVQLLEFGVKK